MTTIDTHQAAASASADHTGADHAGGLLSAIADWATSFDHKKIGRLFVGAAVVELISVAVVGVLLGLERMSDTSSTVDFNSLLQLFGAYRFGLVVAVAAPISIGLAVAVAPLQVGARTMAFPRLALFGFYLWFGGSAMTFASLIANGGVGGGNTDMIDMFLIGNGLALAGLCAAAVALATTIMSTRAPGMTLGRVPIFAWSALVAAIGIILMVPVAIGIIILLFVDHRYGGSHVFGGSEGIVAWLGWIWSTPAVLVFTVPAFGVFSELVPVTFRSLGTLPGVRRVNIALIGVVALAALTQQRMFGLTFGGGQGLGTFISDLVIYALFVGLPLLGIFGSGLVGFATVRDGMSGGRPSLNTPFNVALYALGLLIAAFVANAVMSITNFDLVGTAFEEGVVILAAYGVALATIAGLVFWAPKLSGRHMSAARVLPLASLIAIGAAVAGGAMLVAGVFGQGGTTPNNDAAVSALLDISDSAPIWNLLSLIGHGAVGVGVLLLVLAMWRTPIADDREIAQNPYGGLTLEWTAPSPAPTHNFEHVPTVSSMTPAYRPTRATGDEEGSDS